MRFAWRQNMEMPLCERLLYVCRTIPGTGDQRPATPMVSWIQVSAPGSHATEHATKSGRVLRFLSCLRCHELSEITADMFDSRFDVRASDLTGIPPTLECPRCRESLANETTLGYFGTSAPRLEFDDPLNEGTEIVLVDGSVLRRAEACIFRCEHCTEDAEITFDYVLDAVTGCDPTVTHYMLYRPAKCPHCDHDVTEKTLVIPD
jgi:hypothetical protein